MPSLRMRAPRRWIPGLGALLWSLWILRLGTEDPQRVVGLDALPSEAIQHVVAFAVLGSLTMLAVRGRRGAVTALVAAAGVTGELAQLLISSRTFSVTDLLFSVAGAVAGVAIVRGFGWLTTVAALTVGGVVLAMSPVVLEPPPSPVVTSFPDACFDAPPLVGGEPGVVFQADVGESGAGTTGPVQIDEPTVAEVRDRLLVTDEFSVAVDFRSESDDQEGPVRLFTISGGTVVDQVNFHLGVEHDDLSIRWRTSCELFNSVIVPDVVTAGVDQRVVVTWGAGRLGVWVDGSEAFRADVVWGDLERWDPTFAITVGAEVGGTRLFDGAVYAVTMWDRALDETSIVGESDG